MGDLLEQPARYEFFQAMRLIENGAIDGVRGRPVGFDHEPRYEVARFRSTPSLSFPPNAIRSMTRRRSPVTGDAKAVDVTVAFMGALGACAVLPWHYSEQVFERLSRRDSSLRDFVDMLQHRCIAFMYRAWQKYRLPFAYEAARRDGRSDDVTTLLSALVGLATPGLRDRPAETADRWVYFAGLFARAQRTSVGLEAMLEEVCGYPVEVQEFVGRWQTLVPEERSRLGGGRTPDDFRNQLGSSLVMGDRVWDVLSGIRIKIGPVDARDVCHLAPRTGRFPWLGALVRSYLGGDVDFEIVCRIKRSTVQPARLGAGQAASLGESFWLAAREPEQYDADVPICLDK